MAVAKREVCLSLVAADDPPLAPPKSNKKVLDEDAYVSSLEKIIVRDFFPDLPELREKQEYMEALRTNDTGKLRQLHLKYTSKLTPGTRPPSVVPTPSSVFETPIDKSAKQPLPKLIHPDGDEHDERPTHNPQPKPVKKRKDDTNLSLDKFLAKNTSEDNASFVEIMKESEKKHRIKHAWLFDQEKEEDLNKATRLALPSVDEQAAIEATGKVDTWTYKAKNAVMYIPEGQLTSPQDALKIKAKGGRQITHANTRLGADPFGEAASQEAVRAAKQGQNAALLMGKVGVDGKEVLPKTTPRVNGYGFVHTPTPAPGVSDTPLMTWGQIEGTPFGLDGGATPRPSTLTPGAPQFRIPDVPTRDRLGLVLAERASKAHRDKKNEALRRVQRSMATPSPRFGASKTERLTGLSPAAQRLASGRLKISMSKDRALANSYTPSPASTRGGSLKGTPTPGGGVGGRSLTPSPATSSGASRKHSAVKRPPTGGAASLTDNLLSLPKRTK